MSKSAPERAAFVALVWRDGAVWGRLAKQAVLSLGADGRYDLDACRVAYLKHGGLCQLTTRSDQV
jgi:hypothetical protein